MTTPRKITAEELKNIIGKREKQVFSIQARAKDAEGEDSRVRPVAYLSGAEVVRPWGIEIIDVPNIDHSDMNNSAPLLKDHEWKRHMGKVMEGTSRSDGDGLARCDIYFTRHNQLGVESLNMVDEGTLTKCSCSYEIVGAEYIGDRDDMPMYLVRVKPFEVSLLAVPADFDVGISREKDNNNNQENLLPVEPVNNNEQSRGKTMENNEQTPAGKEGAVEGKSYTPEQIKEIESRAKENALKEKETYESSIETACKIGNCEARAKEFIKAKKTLDEVNTIILEARAKEQEKNGDVMPGKIESGSGDAKLEREQRSKAFANLVNPAIEVAPEHAVDGIVTLAKMEMRSKGEDISLLNNMQIAEKIMKRSQSTSDLPNIIQDGSELAVVSRFSDLTESQDFRQLISERPVNRTDNIKMIKSGAIPDLSFSFSRRRYSIC